MNSSSYSTVVKRISCDINVPFFSPIFSPLIFNDPFIRIISYQQNGMINLWIRFTWKCSTSIILPIISTYCYHYRTCLKHVDNLWVTNAIKWITSFCAICKFHVLFVITAHAFITFLTLVWSIKLIRNTFIKC